MQRRAIWASCGRYLLLCFLFLDVAPLSRAQTPRALPAAQLGVSYDVRITVQGGLRPAKCRVTSKKLPEGLDLLSSCAQKSGVTNPKGGGIAIKIAGTPKKVGNYTFTLKASDFSKPPQSWQREFSLAVNAVPIRITQILKEEGGPARLLPFSGGNVEVKYVAGTMDPSALGQLGCLAILVSPKSALPAISGNYLEFIPRSQGWLSRAFGFSVHIANPSWYKRPCTNVKEAHKLENPRVKANSTDSTDPARLNPADLWGDCNEEFGGRSAVVDGTKKKPSLLPLCIPFKKVKVLWSGQVLSPSALAKGPAALLPAFTSLAAFGTALAKATGPNADLLLAGGAAAGVYGAASLVNFLNNKTQNYMEIFFKLKAPSPTGDCPKPHLQTCHGSQSPSDNPYQACSPTGTPCEVAIFQFIDRHDYWNTYSILVAQTGKQFLTGSSKPAGKTATKQSAN